MTAILITVEQLIASWPISIIIITDLLMVVIETKDKIT